MEKFPMGMRFRASDKEKKMRFRPSEKEKIAYLLYKVNGKPLPCDDFISINTVDIYGDEEPWEIFKYSDDHESYFFTRLKKVKQTGNDCQIFHRNVGKGMWKIYGHKVSICDSRKEVIGFSKNYKYKSKKNADQDGKWLLKEYTLADKFKCCVKDDYIYYTFCSVKKSHDEYVSGQEKDIESFFDQMLEENSMASSSSSSFNHPPQTSVVPGNTESGILRSNDLPDSNPCLDLELSL